MSEKAIVHPSILETIGSDQWMRENSQKLIDLVPEEVMMSVELENELTEKLSTIGILTQSYDEFVKIMHLFIMLRLYKFDNGRLSSNKDYVFKLEEAMMAW